MRSGRCRCRRSALTRPSVTGLRRAGLKTIGDVADRARHEITARFGAGFTALLEQALGQSDAPISPRKPLPDYIVEKRFAEPVATEAVISATLSGLAEMLVAAMAQQGKGARRLEARFFRTDGAVRTIMVDTGQPVTRGEVIDRLFRERLDALSDPLDPGFGFDLIRLCASRTEIVVQQQRDLDANVHDNDELAALIDRIAARIGGKARGRAPCRRTPIFRSARCWRRRRNIIWPLPRKRSGRRALAGEPPLRPLRLFERPEQIKVIAQVPDGPPARFVWRRATHAVVRAEGPERVAMEWWRTEGTMPTRDYFRVEDEAGLRFWLYRRRTLRPRDRAGRRQGRAAELVHAWIVRMTTPAYAEIGITTNVSFLRGVAPAGLRAPGGPSGPLRHRHRRSQHDGRRRAGLQGAR